MNGRRRHPRFLVPEPIEALLRVREEVAVKTWNPRGVEVLSPTPCRRGERLMLEVGGSAGASVGAVVRESHVAVGPGGALRYRLLLDFDDDPGLLEKGRAQ
jgi:hypothetical protein